MAAPRRMPPSKRFRLNAKIRSIAAESDDSLTREVQNAVKEFENSDVVGFEYRWKYLPDDKLVQLCGDNFIKRNHASLSRLARIIEAFEIASVWRSRDLAASCVDALNNDHLISAGALARSLIEVTVYYGYAANILRASFEQCKWETICTHEWYLDQTDEKGKKIGLEIFIERLMNGTRLRERIAENPDLEQKNILSYIDQIDKALIRKGSGYSVKYHYEFLCELAHPNAIGYQRFLDSEHELGSGWIERHLRERANSTVAIRIASECLWALAFSTGSMSGLFHEFQHLKKTLAIHLGRIMPH